jgi:hypothetical protein
MAAASLSSTERPPWSRSFEASKPLSMKSPRSIPLSSCTSWEECGRCSAAELKLEVAKLGCCSNCGCESSWLKRSFLPGDEDREPCVEPSEWRFLLMLCVGTLWFDFELGPHWLLIITAMQRSVHIIQ